LQKGGFYSVVSCGFGTWGPPLRIGNRPEVVEITMNFT
jgi:predicted MPP superfamily phosphohydrolase